MIAVVQKSQVMKSVGTVRLEPLVWFRLAVGMSILLMYVAKVVREG